MKPEPVMVTDSPFFKPVEGEMLIVGLARAAKVIAAWAASPAVALDTEITHAVRSLADVPQVLEPIVPVFTVNVVDGKVPSLLAVIGVAPAVLQPAAEVAEARHSTANSESPGVKPEPVIVTVWPFVNPVDGVTVIDGPEGAAVDDAVAKVIGADATRVPARVPIAIRQFASEAEVPQVPLPIEPVWT